MKQAVLLLAAILINGAAASVEIQPDAQLVPRSLIIGGSAATDLEFPFFVQAKGSMCGGTLVAKNVVLTAAHCEDDFNGQVLVGAWLVNETIGTSAQWRNVSSGMLVHPQYNNDTGENDFMLFRIEPVTNPDLVPIELNTDPNVPNLADQFVVVGMGFNSSSYTTPDRLLKTRVRYIDHDLCQGQWNSTDDDSLENATKLVYNESMFCAIGGFTGANGPAKGDSGGPVIDPNTNRLVGIVSWGAADKDKWATPYYPAVFARVSSAAAWIQEMILDPTAFPEPKNPTEAPTEAPMQLLTHSSTVAPTKVPTNLPTTMPTRFPTKAPTKVPTTLPTATPTQFPTKAPTNMPTKVPTVPPTRFPTKAPVGVLVENLGETSFVVNASTVNKTLRKALDVNNYPGAKGCLHSVQMTLDSKLLGSGAQLSNQIVIGSKFYKPNTLLAGRKSATYTISPCLRFGNSRNLRISLNSTKVVLPGSALKRKYNVKVKLNGQRL